VSATNGHDVAFSWEEDFDSWFEWDNAAAANAAAAADAAIAANILAAPIWNQEAWEEHEDAVAAADALEGYMERNNAAAAAANALAPHRPRWNGADWDEHDWEEEDLPLVQKNHAGSPQSVHSSMPGLETVPPTPSPSPPPLQLKNLLDPLPPHQPERWQVTVRPDAPPPTLDQMVLWNATYGKYRPGEEQPGRPMPYRQTTLYSVSLLALVSMYGTIARSATAQQSNHCTANLWRSVLRYCISCGMFFLQWEKNNKSLLIWNPWEDLLHSLRSQLSMHTPAVPIAATPSIEQIKVRWLDAALPVACIMVSFFVVPFSSALLFSSAIHSATAYQCPEFDSAEPLCPGICCQWSDRSPIQLLTTCQIQAAWFASSNRMWVWPFLTFRFTYYWSQEDIMGGTPAKPAVSKKETEVLTLHPSWELHINEETNSGIFFSLLNVHVTCALGTILFCLCIMICILLGYLGYHWFCHRQKKKTKEATAPPPPPTCATCSSCSPPSASLRPWDKEAMEEKYHASMRQQDDFDDFGFAPQNQRYDCYDQPKCYEQNSAMSLSLLYVYFTSYYTSNVHRRSRVRGITAHSS
jgi:hypothetical protein